MCIYIFYLTAKFMLTLSLDRYLFIYFIYLQHVFFFFLVGATIFTETDTMTSYTHTRWITSFCNSIMIHSLKYYGLNFPPHLQFVLLHSTTRVLHSTTRVFCDLCFYFLPRNITDSFLSAINQIFASKFQISVKLVGHQCRYGFLESCQQF